MKFSKISILVLAILFTISCKTNELVKAKENPNYIIRLNYLHDGSTIPFYERKPKSKEELIDGQLYLLQMLDSSVLRVEDDSLFLKKTLDSMILNLKNPINDRIKQLSEPDFEVPPMKFDIYSKLYLDSQTVIQDHSRYLKIFQKNKERHGVFQQSAVYSNKIYYYEEKTKSSVVLDSLINIKLDKSQTVVFNGIEGNPYTITEKGSYYGSPTTIIHEGIAKLDFPMSFYDHVNIGFIYDNKLNGLILKNDRYIVNKDTNFEKELEYSIQLFSYEILKKKDWTLKKIFQNKYPNKDLDSVRFFPKDSSKPFYLFE